MASAVDLPNQLIEVEKEYELHPIHGQKKGEVMKWFNLEKYLQENKFISRVFGLDDNLVKEWIANPSTYPEELKGKNVFPLKSAENPCGNLLFPSLYWRNECVNVRWGWIDGNWGDNDYVLLKPPLTSTRD